MDTLLQVIDYGAEWLVGLIIFIGVGQNLVSLLQLFIATQVLKEADIHDRNEGLWQRTAPGATPIALIAPAYNEANTIVESLKSLLSLHYPFYEVIVVNDGSRDETLQILIDNFDLKPSSRAYDLEVQHKPIRQIYQSPRYKNLVVIDKENGGKADALNAGINLSRAPLFCAVDADSMLEREALLLATEPFRENPEEVIAVGGTIRVANGCLVQGGKVVKVGLPRKLLPLIQNVEYIRAFLIARVAMSELRVLTMISGAFGIFLRKSAIAAGGYATDTVGEDYELVLRMHRYHIENKIPYRIVSAPAPVCWTEAPDTLRILGSQRRRWQRGSLETFFRHRHMLFNPRYGRIGMIGMPFSLLVDVLGPISEIAGYLLVPTLYFSGMLNADYALAFLGLTFVFGIYISAGSMILEEVSLHRMPRAIDLLKVLGIILIENIGYRQLCNVWRIQGWYEFLRKRKGWGKMTRTGFMKS
jgi:cellulose synthase/poly-beta-1,6-N-acetylglucosamine synthase-like glycosyltransferase